MKIIRTRAAKEFALTYALSFATYVFVLKFVFPGYFSPLWPHHSDFYMITELANTTDAITGILRGARPAGFLFMYVIGKLGLHGAISIIVAICIFNTTAIAMLTRRVFMLPLSGSYAIGLIIYFFSVYSSPAFYIFYTHDCLAQASMALLLCGGALYTNYVSRSQAIAFVALAMLCTLSFLFKETFVLSALTVSVGYALLSKGDLYARLSPIFIVLATATFALVHQKVTGSPFVSGTGDYTISISPSFVLNELWRYIAGTMNWFLAIGLLIAGISALVDRERRTQHSILLLIILVASFASLLPNSIIKNHFYLGYSIGATCLLFSIFLLPFALRVGRHIGLLLISTASLVLLSPFGHSSRYSENQWVLLQEATQRNLLKAISENISSLPSAHASRVLITGITFPFSPFSRPKSLAEFLANRSVRFDVVSYSDKALPHSIENVTFVDPDWVDPSVYDMVMALNMDGTLRYASTKMPINIVFPEVDAETTTSSLVIGVARAYLQYNQPAKASQILQAAILSAPNDPYLYFFLGQAQEQQGLRAAARDAYERAVRSDGTSMPNPYFKAALDRLNSSGTD